MRSSREVTHPLLGLSSRFGSITALGRFLGGVCPGASAVEPPGKKKGEKLWADGAFKNIVVAIIGCFFIGD